MILPYSLRQGLSIAPRVNDVAGVTSGLPHLLDIYKGSRDLNSGPYACIASIILLNNLPSPTMLSQRTQSNVLE